MKKISNIHIFASILSIATLICLIFRIPFRIIALQVLNGNDYSIFSLSLRTFLVIFQITGLNLDSPLTREIRFINNSKNIKINYAISYWLTSFSGIIILFIFWFFYFNVFTIIQISIFLLTIIFGTFSKFFLAFLKAQGYATKLALIAIISSSIKILVIIPFIFEIQISLEVFIYLYCFSHIIEFLMGFIFSKLNLKILIISVQKMFKKKKIISAIQNVKKGFLLSIRDLFRTSGLWLITFFAISILTYNSFKIFDICLYFISIIEIICYNITTSVLSVSKIKENSRIKKTLFYLIIVGIIIIIFSFIISEFIPLDISLFSLKLTIEGKNIILSTIILSVFMLLTAFLNGKIQLMGKYKEVAVISIISFLGLLFFSILGYFMKYEILIIMGLIVLYLIQAISFYYLSFKSFNNIQ
jgi:hypothetical protein